MVPGLLDLLPHDERQPGLNDIGHFIHGRHDNGALLVVMRAYFMRPCVAEARDAAAEAGEDVAGPLPLDGYVPDGQADVAHDVYAAAEDNGLPA